MGQTALNVIARSAVTKQSSRWFWIASLSLAMTRLNHLTRQQLLHEPRHDLGRRAMMGLVEITCAK